MKISFSKFAGNKSDLFYKTEQSRNNTNLESKNKNTACVSLGQQGDFRLITAINFIEQTIKTFSNYEEQRKIQRDSNLTQQDK